MIKAVIFDIDGVLLDSFEANLIFFQNLMNKSGYKPPTRQEFQTMFHLSLVETIKILTKSTSEEEIKKIYDLGESSEIGYHTELIKMPEGSEEILKSLSKNYTLAIVTGRTKSNVYEVPELAKLRNYFKIAISYQDTENHKPHPEPLLLAAQKLNIQPEETVYIGDVENDIKAARAAGMKIIIYSKNKIGDADAYASSFIELPELIKSL
ncbi:MAG: HAD family hydrolase [Candidatus Paceibacterota bacterium]|jgi:HAD superfamily hydrolase (TIGR01549 family)